MFFELRYIIVLLKRLCDYFIILWNIYNATETYITSQLLSSHDQVTFSFLCGLSYDAFHQQGSLSRPPPHLPLQTCLSLFESCGGDDAASQDFSQVTYYFPFTYLNPQSLRASFFAFSLHGVQLVPLESLVWRSLLFSCQQSQFQILATKLPLFPNGVSNGVCCARPPLAELTHLAVSFLLPCCRPQYVFSRGTGTGTFWFLREVLVSLPFYR